MHQTSIQLMRIASFEHAKYVNVAKWIFAFFSFFPSFFLRAEFTVPHRMTYNFVASTKRKLICPLKKSVKTGPDGVISRFQGRAPPLLLLFIVLGDGALETSRP